MFRTSGEVIELYADRSRQLRMIDPAGRQLHISCGAALLHVRVVAEALGFAAAVTLLPKAGDPDHLATIRLAPDRAHEDALRLAEAVERRHTVRDPFLDRPLPADVLERLRAAAATEHATLHPVTRPADLTTLTLLLERADEAERADPEYQAELAAWVRPPGSQAPDGVPAEALPHVAPGTWVTAAPARDFEGHQPLAPGQELPPRVEHPLVVFVLTEHDDPVSWLEAGQALGRVLLELASSGLAAQPLNQVLDLSAYREQVRHALGLLGHPQMLLRIGYADEAQSTPRRALHDVLQQEE